MKTKFWGAVGAVVATLLSAPTQAATVYIDATPGGQYQSAPGPCYGCFGLSKFVFPVSPGDIVQFGTVVEDAYMGYAGPGGINNPFIIGLASVSFDPATPPYPIGGDSGGYWWNYIGSCNENDTACIAQMSAIQRLITLTYVVPDGADTIQVAWAANGTYDPPSISSIVPLPAALPLFASGLAGLGLLGWRRKKRAAPLNT